MGRFPGTPLGFVVVALSAIGGHTARAQEVAFPDFDLRMECMRQFMGAPGATLEFPVDVVLATSPGGTDGVVGARAWSLSIVSGRGARIIEASTEGTPAAPSPAGLLDDGYEKTEVIQGDGNEGVVSAVILSFSKDVYLPGSSEETLLHMVMETMVPSGGCIQVALDFVDGLVGSGQPVKNIITFGEDSGFTRRDDGGALDNDTDGYEPCVFLVCDGPYFVRGDANGDFDVTLTDAIALLEHLFLETGPLACSYAADVLGDGDVNLSDGVYLLNHLFLGGAPPAAPYPECGLAAPAAGGTLGCDPTWRCR